MRDFFRCLAVAFVFSLVSCVVGPDAARADAAVVLSEHSFDGDGEASADAAFDLLRKKYKEQREPVFNALDKSDKAYQEYQRNLCQGAYQEYQRFFSERFWLDQEDPKLAMKTEGQRQDWVFNYVVTTHLRDTMQQRFDANCLR